MSTNSDESNTNSSRSRMPANNDSLLLEFRRRRLGGERITAAQFISERHVQDDPELIVDLAFADFLESEKNGEAGVGERLCKQFPDYAREIRRQILFHQALARPSADTLEDGSGRESDSNDIDQGGPISDETLNRFSIPGLELVRPIGRGGMGVVYLAHQPKLKRKVAVKLLLGGMYASALHRARFRAEAQAAASLRHPNIVQIDEVGESQGQPYLVMEYVEGGTLEEFIKKQNPSPHESAEFVLTLARAIHEAHRRGIIHRDLKPGNIMLAPQVDGLGSAKSSQAVTADSLASLKAWIPKITDFGLAKILGEEQTGIDGLTLTIAGDLLGTPSYMAPEQASGGAIGTWSDVYSLGAILYQLLSGRPPFLAATAFETLEQVLNDEPPALPRSVPLNLRTICMTCLRKQPMSRYTSMSLVVSDLECFLQGKPISARRSSTFEQVSSWCKRNRAVASLGSTVFVALLTILGITLWSRTQLSLALSENELARQREAASHARSLENLWDSKIAQAQAQQSTGRAGQRFNALASIAEAQDLLKQVGASPERLATLRDTAIACLPLDDITKVADWHGMPNYEIRAVDRTLNRVAQIVDNQTVLVTEDFGVSKILEVSSFGADRLALSPDGRWLAAWGEDCRVYDLQSPTMKIVGTYASGGCWGFSPDGNWMVGADRAGTIVVDLRTHSIVHRVDTPKPSHLPTFSDDSRKVALLSERSLVVLDIESGTTLTQLEPPVDAHGVQCLAWHRNNAFLAVAGYRSEVISVWDITTQKLYRKFCQPGGAISLAFDGSGNSLITSSAWLGEVNVFDLESESLRLSMRVLNNWLAVSPDSGVRMLVRSVTNTYELLDIRTQSIIQPFHSLSRSKVKRYQAITSPNGRWSAVTTERGLEIYDDHAKLIVAELSIGELAFNRLFFDSSERLWACLEDGWLRWTFNDSELLPPVKLETSAGFAPITVDHSGNWTLTSNDRQLKLESMTVPRREIFLGESLDVRNASFSSDGRMVATGEWNGSGGVKVWNVADGKLIAQLKTGFYCEVLFSPDSKYLFTSPNGGEVWETESWTKYHRLESTSSSAGGGFAFAFSPDGKWLANSHSTGMIAIWDIHNRKRVSTLRDPEQTTIAMLGFSKDQVELRSISVGPHSTFKSWDFGQIGRELQDIGVDSPVTTFRRAEPAESSQSYSSSLKEFSVGHNKILDELLEKQLWLEVSDALDESKWQTAWQLSGEWFAQRFKRFWWKR